MCRKSWHVLYRHCDCEPLAGFLGDPTPVSLDVQDGNQSGSRCLLVGDERKVSECLCRLCDPGPREQVRARSRRSAKSKLEQGGRLTRLARLVGKSEAV